MSKKFNRILLKLSGEQLSGKFDGGIDAIYGKMFPKLQKDAQELVKHFGYMTNEIKYGFIPNFLNSIPGDIVSFIFAAIVYIIILVRN